MLCSSVGFLVFTHAAPGGWVITAQVLVATLQESRSGKKEQDKPVNSSQVELQSVDF